MSKPYVPPADEIRRVWFAAHLMVTWKEDVRPKLAKAYKAVGRVPGKSGFFLDADADGKLLECLVELRGWFAGAVAAIDEFVENAK